MAGFFPGASRPDTLPLRLAMRSVPLLSLLLLTHPLQAQTLPAGTRVEARLESHVRTATSNPGDPVIAVVAEPVRAGSRIVIPQGTHLNGRIETIAAGSSSNEGRVRLVFRDAQFPD